ncbi:hypothetical protein [Glutamicibacter sp.]|uniref:hypothetical protein n=1 Tax=Glutamicibacter sp. TaxID=1931995 RepID=UPI003D6B617B
MNPEDAHPSNQNDPQWDALVENFRQLDASAPREPSADERAAKLEKLFNTGPAAVRGPRDYVAEETPEEFVPEEPAALGSGDPMLNLAWVGAAGGPLGLLLCVLFFRSAPVFIYFGLAIVALLGIAYLLKRLPTERDPGDDGAQV